MNTSDFRKYAHELVDWMAWYMDNVESFPVKPGVKPGEIFRQIPESPPAEAESFDRVFNDFLNVIMPGITHWQSPNFYAYFPANTSPPSVLAEMITATLGAQCMIWETSPAAAELEERVLNWLRDAMGLPAVFEGVIHDTASVATLCALISARERTTGFAINEEGHVHGARLRVYASAETHSSVEKGVKVAGLGRNNLVKIRTLPDGSMDADSLAGAILADKASGYVPCCVVATLGTTGSTAVDPVGKIAAICREHSVWLHVDAALAGTALLLPEFRYLAVESAMADSLVFNPHKWMFTNFDCSVYFVRDAAHLIRTFEILPEYLKTLTRGTVNDYRDWGVPLGRRFRALKLWWVIRCYGMEGIREKIRFHITLASTLAGMVKSDGNFELIRPPLFNTVCFRFIPQEVPSHRHNEINEKLNHMINDSGKIYLTHTVIDGKYLLRMVTGQTNVTMEHVEEAWETIRSTATMMLREGYL
ncbi:MAG: aspartate aminotransferase family protein [Bacteroidetes bacterium]|nr:aspartate aminotransferase family protein [Bacteroidota bacterium]